MIQVIIRNGNIHYEETPRPVVEDGKVLIKVHYSSVSPGTEISTLKNSKLNIVSKATSQPEKVVKYLNKIKKYGFSSVYREIQSAKLFGTAIGYSVSGEVIAVGKGVRKFAVGEKVAAAGGGHAYHAEYVVVPENLVVKIAQDINMAEASTVALGAIALQGVRRADLKIGEFGVVVGVGLLGLLTIQLLKKSGVSVIAIDKDDYRLSLAMKSGADYTFNASDDSMVKSVNQISGGMGCDAVVFCAATGSSEPLSKAFQMIRRKGKLVLVGVSGMEINREDIYSKEIDFLISSSYGPGRYDPIYEEKNIDYPYAFVRWTENRNMEEYCRLISVKAINLEIIDYQVFDIKNVAEAFTNLKAAKTGNVLAILEYKTDNSTEPKQVNISRNLSNSKIRVAVVGAGSFAVSTILPTLEKLNNFYEVYGICSHSGVNAKNVAELFNATMHTSDYDSVIKDKNVDLIVICNKHKEHFDFAYRALLEKKNVFVEKPLCTTKDQLEKLEKVFNDTSHPLPFITVGYNRRHSSFAKSISEVTSKRINPLFITYRMNVGYVPQSSWLHEDGGRIVGECCHIVDLMSFLVGSPVLSFSWDSLQPKTDYFSSSDNKSLVIRYQDGSLANINYLAIGNGGLPKEYMEVHFDGKSIVMTDYEQLDFFGVNRKNIKNAKADKGHFEEFEVLATSIRDGNLPIALWDLLQTSRITLEVAS